MRAFWVGATAALVIAACRDNPNIDGSKVAASGATCPEVCNRLVALCGYAPPDCTDVDGGYCETNFDDTILACMSTASSCQAAWDCPTVVPVTEDAGDDGATDDSSTSDDSATGDAAAD
jgi:hypothetical protein